MDPGHVVVEKIVALLEREMHADAGHHFRIVFAPLQGAKELCRKSGAAGQLGDPLAAAHRRDRHDPGDDRNANAGELAAFAEIVEVAVIEEKLRDDVVRARIDLRFEVLHFHESIRRRGMPFRESGHAYPKAARIGIILTGGNVDLDALPWMGIRDQKSEDGVRS